MRVIEDYRTPIPAAHLRTGPDRIAEDGPLERLERLLRELPSRETPQEQIRLTLHAVQDCLAADTVFWYAGPSDETSIVVGSTELDRTRCQRFTERLLAETPGLGNQYLRAVLEPIDLGTGRPAQSVAMTRVSKSRQTWIVAVSFTPQLHFRPLDMRMLSLACRMLTTHRANTSAFGRLKETMHGIVRCLGVALDAKDPNAWGHSERVAEMAVRFGERIGLAEDMLSDLYLAALLHDIGNLGLPEGILAAPGPLSEAQRKHIDRHSELGERILEDIKPLAHLAPIVRAHHERFDGTGYPDRLRGDAIPLPARMIALLDACDAMLTEAPHRLAQPSAVVRQRLKEGAGTQWDPRLVQALLTCFEQLEAICRKEPGNLLSRAIERTLRASGGTDAIAPSYFG